MRLYDGFRFRFLTGCCWLLDAAGVAAPLRLTLVMSADDDPEKL